MYPLKFFVAVALIIAFVVFFLSMSKNRNKWKCPAQPAFNISIPNSPVLFINPYRECLINSAIVCGRAQYYKSFGRLVNECGKQNDAETMAHLTPLQNNDETKYIKRFTSRLEANEECNIISLGIGRDTLAETKLKKMVPKQCKFFGADPVEKVNKQMYSAIGEYFNTAVGARNGYETASILLPSGAYVNANMSHTNLMDFLLKSVKVNRIVDILFMDNEGAEYDLAPFFLPGGDLDRHNIIVCQWTCEFHSTNLINQLKFTDFMFLNLVYGKYVPFTIVQSVHIRVNLFNVFDKVCLERYWSKMQL